MILIFVLLITLINLRELPHLLRKGKKQEKILYVFLTALNLVVAILEAMDIKIPTPHDAIVFITSLLLGSG